LEQTFERLFISMPGMVHEPSAVQSQSDSTCEALFWIRDRHAIVLFIDSGVGASVANAIDLLIPFAIKTALIKRRVPWKNVRFFARDFTGAFDEVVIDAYDGHWDCEANWIRLPSASRTIDGFRKVASSAGFVFHMEHEGVIQEAIERWARNFKQAA